MNYKLNMQN